MKTTVLPRVIRPERGDLSPEVAAYILQLGFSDADHARYRKLSGKAQDSALSSPEQVELDDYLNVNALLMILQSKARASVQNGHAAL